MQTYAVVYCNVIELTLTNFFNVRLKKFKDYGVNHIKKNN